MAKTAFKQVWKSITGIPAADFADKRYHFAKYNADGDIVLAGAGDHAIGVLEEPNNVGEPTQVVASGFMFVYLGAAIPAGTSVAVGAGGTAVAATEGDHVVGVLAVGGASGALGTILLK